METFAVLTMSVYLIATGIFIKSVYDFITGRDVVEQEKFNYTTRICEVTKYRKR